MPKTWLSLPKLLLGTGGPTVGQTPNHEFPNGHSTDDDCVTMSTCPEARDTYLEGHRTGRRRG